MWDTLLINGTDIATTNRIVQVRDGFYEGPEARGGLLTLPGKDGETNVDQPFGPTVFSIGLFVQGSSFTTLNDEYRTLRQLCAAGRTVTLTKQTAYTAGNETYTATAKLIRVTPNRLSPIAMKAVVEFSVLDGLWYATPLTVSTGTVSVAGDVRTQRMTVTLAGSGTNPTLTNSTNGWALTYTGSTATSTVIDTEAMTAFQGATNVSQNLSWTKLFPFRLDPGSNTLTCSSGTASIAYSPAYL